jgi:hypothetical protein
MLVVGLCLRGKLYPVSKTKSTPKKQTGNELEYEGTQYYDHFKPSYTAVAGVSRMREREMD